ncbi:MAG TPA: TolC family protein [Thermoanaerobaculia bacterium]|nr:TolC family protein [Thermoanaerobaculia bacterium]
MNEIRENLARRPWATRALIALIALHLLGAVPVAAAAGPRVVPSAPGSGGEGAALRIQDGKLRLTLDESIEQALARNLGIRVERYSRAQARLGIQEAMGIYDLGLGGNLSASHSESATASSLEGAAVQEQDVEALSFGVSQLFSTGGTLEAQWTSNRLETNSQFFLLNPSYDAGIDVAFRQPLLQNRGRNPTDFGLRVARLASDQALKSFEDEISSTILQVEIAYWGVVEAQEQLKVAEESRRLANQLHENNKVRVDVGTLAPLELVSSEAGIATREEEVIRFRAAVGNAEDVLKSLLHVEGTAAWAAAIEAETNPEIEHPQVNLEQSLESALQARPELARERLAQQSRELEAAYYQAQMQPRLDLRVGYGFNGVGGDLVVRDENGNIVSTVPGGLSDAVDQITGGDFPAWSIALEFGYPLQNRSARARATIAELAADQGDAVLSQLELITTTEVRLAVRAMETASQELDSARVSVRLQTANIDAERKKFLNGLSTSFQILEVEEDLTNARSREVRAVTGYRRALVGYYRAIGKLLEQSGVSIAD